MPSVSVNPPKTPVTKGSNGLAMATVPNVCKMPGPPAPFIPVPLPNIGQSGKQPKGYSTTVTIEGQTVAIRGATFGSSGDVASKGTGGGLISSNTEGPTKFLAPGSLNVKIEGKNVHLLSDQMLNNCGPSGSPPNAATLAGLLQPPLIVIATELGVLAEAQAVCDALCECTAAGQGQNCISANLKAKDAASGGLSTIKAESPFDMSTSPPSPTSYPGDRRPDVVVVANGARPPTQDNIKAVIEVKLRSDRWRGSQKTDYERIAGDPDKVVEINSENCKCPDEPKPKPYPVPVPAKAKDRQLSFSWLKPVAVGVAAVTLVAAAAALAPAAGAAVGAAAVFALFVAPSASGGSGNEI